MNWPKNMQGAGILASGAILKSLDELPTYLAKLDKIAATAEK